MRAAVKNLRPWREEFEERDVRVALRDAGLPHWRFTVWSDSSMTLHPPAGRDGPVCTIPAQYLAAVQRAFAPDALEVSAGQDGNGRVELWVDIYWLRAAR